MSTHGRKFFISPGDKAMLDAKYVEHQTWNQQKVMKSQRNERFKQIHVENQKILDRIMCQKPSFQLEEIKKWNKK